MYLGDFFDLTFLGLSFRVAVPLCGGNIDPSVLSFCIEKGLALDGRLMRFVVTVEENAGGLARLIALLATVNAQ